jgi:hypothetical protein
MKTKKKAGGAGAEKDGAANNRLDYSLIMWFS